MSQLKPTDIPNLEHYFVISGSKKWLPCTSSPSTRRKIDANVHQTIQYDLQLTWQLALIVVCIAARTFYPNYEKFHTLLLDHGTIFYSLASCCYFLLKLLRVKWNKTTSVFCLFFFKITDFNTKLIQLFYINHDYSQISHLWKDLKRVISIHSFRQYKEQCSINEYKKVRRGNALYLLMYHLSCLKNNSLYIFSKLWFIYIHCDILMKNTNI